MIPAPKKGQFLNAWVPLLTEFELEALKNGGGFLSPHPAFPERVDRYYLCGKCHSVHWQRLSVNLRGFGGELSVSVIRHADEEVAHMRERVGNKQFDETFAREHIKNYQGEMRKYPCEIILPDMCEQSLRYELEAGRILYLREIAQTGEDAYSYYGHERKSRQELKLLAKAELESGGKVASA